MERTIDPLLTIDAKLWADEFMATKQRLGDVEFDHAMMLGWFANAIMRGYDEGKRLGAADAQATIAALQAQLKERTAELGRVRGERDLIVEIVGCSKAYLIETLRAVMQVYHEHRQGMEG